MTQTKIYYLAEAVRDHGIGPVATVIERVGISGWDRFGRYLPIDEMEIRAVLDTLAELHREETDFWREATPESDGFLPPSPIDLRTDDFTGNDSLWHFGWFDEARPQFPAGATSRKQVEEEKAISEREKSTLLTTVGALLELMLSESPSGNKHSVFINQAAIIDALLARHGGKAGLSKRTLEAKFAAAKRNLTAT